MKGVILGIQPEASIVDISHEVKPFDIMDGAYTIAQAYRYFPRRTVHVIVVDPGVGTERRPILAEAAGQFFIAPDNGVLSMIWDREATHKVRAIANELLFLPARSRTFHGRDIFAPSGAHLAKGVAPARFGPLVKDYTQLMVLKPQRTARRVWTGAVLKIDRFGNLITNFHIDEFPDMATRPFEIAVGFEHTHRLVSTFAEAASDELVAIVGSSGYLEVAFNQSPAAKRLGCGTGAPVELTFLK
jgi:S-adenosyl-L-methionine hydrolase (adenosine-forming)